MEAAASLPDLVNAEILQFLESSGFTKTARKFRKEAKCATSLPEAILPLSIVIINARRRYTKKTQKRSLSNNAEKHDKGLGKHDKKHDKHDKHDKHVKHDKHDKGLGKHDKHDKVLVKHDKGLVKHDKGLVKHDKKHDKGLRLVKGEKRGLDKEKITKMNDDEIRLKEEVEAFVCQLGVGKSLNGAVDCNGSAAATTTGSTEPSKKRKKNHGSREREIISASAGDLNGLRDEEEGSQSKPAKRAKRSEAPAAMEHSLQTVQAFNQQGQTAPDENGRIQFKRIDEDKWSKTIKDNRLKDQSYAVKNGDRFASAAAADLAKVRGKDFRKQMQKKKRASWKGVGEVDMGVNSVAFSDSD